jgi:hypothetical protein
MWRLMLRGLSRIGHTALQADSRSGRQALQAPARARSKPTTSASRFFIQMRLWNTPTEHM